MGILIAVIGVINMSGNISSIHRYHRMKVTEADIKPFGKLVGLGTLIIGISLVLYGTLYLAFNMTQNGLLLILGAAELIVCIVIGLIISLYAMIKYNKGIF
ncbi:MAG: hypothetical protein IJX92_00135 [Clostridia bacterium]|nr:hypothetical protein [Clostridia bacterium]